jgi:rifampin ADP-ribosylating transferase
VDLTRRAVQLCAEGTLAECNRRLDDARRLYAEAWQCAGDDYERAVAAHYVAHLEPDPAAQLVWNRRALEHAEHAERELAAPLLGSLYVNLGHSYELVGEPHEAERYYALAAEHGIVHARD